MSGFWQWVQQLDETVLLWIQEHCRTSWGDIVMPAVSFLGDNGAVWIAGSAALLISRRTRPYGFGVIGALGISVLTGNLLIKNLVGRARPFTVLPEISLLIAQPTDFSFPSAHTMTSFAAAAVIYQADKRWGVAAGILAALIAFSRMYLFVHFPSDILTGALMGIGAGILASIPLRKYKKT